MDMTSEIVSSGELQEVAHLLKEYEATPTAELLNTLGTRFHRLIVKALDCPNEVAAGVEAAMERLSFPSDACSGAWKAHIALGLRARRRYDHEAAIRHGQLAVKWAEATKSPADVSGAYRGLGIFRTESGHIIHAIGDVLHSYQVLVGVEGPDALRYRVGSAITLGALLTFTGQFRAALRPTLHAAQLCMGDESLQHHLAVCYSNLGSIYAVIGDVRRSLRALAAATAVDVEASQRAGVGEFAAVDAYSCQARVFLELGRTQEAREAIERAARNVGTAWSSMEPHVQLTRGFLMVHEGRTEEGLRLVGEACEAQLSLRPYATAFESLLLAARAFEIAGRPEDAKAKLDRAAALVLDLRRKSAAEDLEIDESLLAEEAVLGTQAPSGAQRVDVVRRLQRTAVIAELPEWPSGTHAFRVGRLARILCEAIARQDLDADAIEVAATLHDIGKVAVPPQLLARESALDGLQLQTLRAHTIRGAELLGEYDDCMLAYAATAARSHHEKWDGTGFPDGLAREAIPIAARIVAIAETFDELTSGRAGRAGLHWRSALQRVLARGGSDFDPQLARVFAAAVQSLYARGVAVDEFLEAEANACDVVRIQARLTRSLATLDVEATSNATKVAA